jgi:hypothetical protein
MASVIWARTSIRPLSTASAATVSWVSIARVESRHVMRGKVTEQLRLRLRTLGLAKIAHQLQRSREHRIGLPSSMAAPAMRRPLQVFDGLRPIRLRADPG